MALGGSEGLGVSLGAGAWRRGVCGRPAGMGVGIAAGGVKGHQPSQQLGGWNAGGGRDRFSHDNILYRRRRAAKPWRSLSDATSSGKGGEGAGEAERVTGYSVARMRRALRLADLRSPRGF